jgi:hypothetical protein
MSIVSKFPAIQVCVILMVLALFPQSILSQERPSVLFMIAEQNVGQEQAIYWWNGFSGGVDIVARQIDLSVAETILKKQFLDTGFNVIDVANVSNKIILSSSYKVADVTKDTSLQLATNVGADVVVKGKVLATEAAMNSASQIKTYIADITATAFRVSDGLVVGSAKGHGVARNVSSVSGGSEAIENAALQLSEQLIRQIESKWDSSAEVR